MPFCPTCGKFVDDGVETCSCGTKFIVSPEDKIKKIYGEEEKLVGNMKQNLKMLMMHRISKIH